MVTQLALFDQGPPPPLAPREEVAAQRAMQALRDCIPPGVPLPVQRVVAAKTTKDLTVARVEMLDGVFATLEVSTWGRFRAWQIHWITDAPEAFYWNGQAWVRERIKI